MSGHIPADLDHDPPGFWYKQSAYSQETSRILWWGLATKTRKSYSTAAKSYDLFCALQGISPAYPATTTSLLEWITHLSVKRPKAKTLKAYLTGVRSVHVDMGHEDLAVFHSPVLQRAIAGVRRMRGEAGTLERRPITKDLLLQMLPHFVRSTREGATMHAAFLRVGEFTYTSKDLQNPEFSKWFLTRRSVALYEDHLELTLPASKTGPFRRGITLNIAASGDDACPVQALRHLFRWKASRKSPLFQWDGAFTRQLVTGKLREILTSLGAKGHYSGHSFRRGAATSAEEAGLSIEEIMLLGRWKSDSYRLYIVTHPERILAASRRHQRGPPHR